MFQKIYSGALPIRYQETGRGYLFDVKYFQRKIEIHLINS